MAPTKKESYQEQNEVSQTARDRKLRRKRHPRGRRLIKRKKPQIEAERAQAARVDSAKQKIAKHLELFPEITSAEGRSQAEKYLDWVADSLSLQRPILEEEDVEYKTAVASVAAGGQKRQKTKSSVRATHLPTQISVRNEEQRILEQNKRAAYENLLNRLTEHLSFWQTLSQKNPDRYSIGEISRQGLSLLKSLMPK